jgi:hypothetical protein
MGTFNFDVGPTHYESDLVVVASALYLNSCAIQGHAVSLKSISWQPEWFLNGPPLPPPPPITTTLARVAPAGTVIDSSPSLAHSTVTPIAGVVVVHQQRHEPAHAASS